MATFWIATYGDYGDGIIAIDQSGTFQTAEEQ